MNADVLTTDGIAVITLGSARRINHLAVALYRGRYQRA